MSPAAISELIRPDRYDILSSDITEDDDDDDDVLCRDQIHAVGQAMPDTDSGCSVRGPEYGC